jgi:DNA-directed RNA polymerase subunit alpha
MVTPKVEKDAEGRNYGKFVIAPLERGYGVTLGNALRRVLLSSLDGAAVTSIRVSDALHEFTDIPGVREDVIQVLLQVKQLRLMIHDVDQSHLHLEVHGEGVVTAADIQCPAEVEIVNPDLYLFTVNDKKTRLEIDLTVERGRGYTPANERTDNLPIGELAVDAIFSPVKRVNWTVQNARVGTSTNFDKLVLEI